MKKKMNGSLINSENDDFFIQKSDEVVVIESISKDEKIQNSDYGDADDYFEIFGDIEDLTM